MPFEKLDLVRWINKDDWWLEDCPLIIGKTYRITDVQYFGGIAAYLMHGWWVKAGGNVHLLENYKFTKGDRVRIALRVEKEEGWQNVWIDRMNGWIGKEFTIRKIGNLGVGFEEDDDFDFPPSCLEPV